MEEILHSNKNIYLIDDDEAYNYINKIILEMAGIKTKIITHTDALIALNQLKDLAIVQSNEFPVYIFLDINMPKMDAWDFLIEFEKLPEKVLDNCGIFILSSSIDPEDVEKSKQYRTVKNFISKPLTQEKIQELNLV